MANFYDGYSSIDHAWIAEDVLQAAEYMQAQEHMRMIERQDIARRYEQDKQKANAHFARQLLRLMQDD